MTEKFKNKRPSKYLLLMVIFLLVVNLSLGYLLVAQVKDSITTLIHIPDLYHIILHILILLNIVFCCKFFAASACSLWKTTPFYAIIPIQIAK